MALYPLEYQFKSGKYAGISVKQVIEQDINHMASIISKMSQSDYERLDARTELYFLQNGGKKIGGQGWCKVQNKNKQGIR